MNFFVVRDPDSLGRTDFPETTVTSGRNLPSWSSKSSVLKKARSKLSSYFRYDHASESETKQTELSDKSAPLTGTQVDSEEHVQKSLVSKRNFIRRVFK